MKYIYTVILFISTFTYSFSQNETSTFSPSDTDSIYVTVERMPEFPGGIPKIGEFLQNNLRYPKAARKANITGKVFGTFIVGEDGTIRDVAITQGIGYGCDEEVMRVISLMPKWIPGVQGGKAVAVRYVLPITFSLKGK
ncbi:energy transducer TonB [Cytophagaceae bacterium YF14B1]|uniref:Energy transducer TonB n=1 Tax=Xanthocytophaga flava TaxID=3048013 RepID=A0AAE3QU92_9BACT|nr:energy transducer TonB [Xanthocytophaga flavus]MDJ1483340.1 energy transducer TonB [Xanthocytophaga flavus]